MKTTNPELPETIIAPRTDPLYNCHAYLTKVPVGAIKPFINAFTDEGDVVADIFAGSGMTGLAALATGRRANLSDISVLGQHIALGFLQNTSEGELRAASDSVMAIARKAMGTLYKTARVTDGQKQEMIRTVWSFTYICPSCKAEMVYYDHLDEKGKPPAESPCCGEPFVKRLWGRGEDVPVRIVVKGEDGKQTEQELSNADMDRIKKATKDRRRKDVPSLPIEEHREMYSRSGLGKVGLTQTAMFFSPRNAIALWELWKAINDVRDDKTRQKLRFAFTAILPRASKRYQWSPSVLLMHRTRLIT